MTLARGHGPEEHGAREGLDGYLESKHISIRLRD